MTSRDILLASLSSRRFDVLVIGGGIVGAGIARDAAMRGLKVALIEQGDFASGTSSKTSKLIHGGLRYLEHGYLRLVFESLRERHVLRTIIPAYVHPLSLLLPVYQGDLRSAWKVRMGLGLYDVLAAGRKIRRHRMVSARRALALEPGLRSEGLRAAGLYADCQMDDARVCLANILQAIGFGAVCGNYVKLRTFLTVQQRVCGGAVEDVLTGRSFDIHAQVVVNATGPWSDRVRRLSDSSAPQRIAPNKGTHLLLPRVAQEALFIQGRADGRMLFLLPWGEYTLVGTTEVPAGDSLESLAASADEVDYLLKEVNRLLPGSNVDADDVVATYAGARPLLAHTGSATQASREHRIEIDRWGLVSVMGGKFTTYRRMAQQAVDVLIGLGRWKADRCLTDQVNLLEIIQPVSLTRWQEVTRSIDPDLLARLLTRYGGGAFRILSVLSREPALAQPVCPHHEYIQAELVHALQGEMACTLVDVLARRTRIAWSPCQGLEALPTVADLCRRYGGATPAGTDAQVEEYRRFLARGLAFRQQAPSGDVLSHT
jgi:glycerol-3-phosphate dehydrogenase